MTRKGLMEQDLSKLDVTKLHLLSPEVISRQATTNISTIGHVAHWKSIVVKVIYGVQSIYGFSIEPVTWRVARVSEWTRSKNNVFSGLFTLLSLLLVNYQGERMFVR